MQPNPDCCPEPELAVVKWLWEPPGPERAVKQCRHCAAWWRFDAEERMNFDGGPDHYVEWYTRLTPDEAKALI